MLIEWPERKPFDIKNHQILFWFLDRICSQPAVYTICYIKNVYLFSWSGLDMSFPFLTWKLKGRRSWQAAAITVRISELRTIISFFFLKKIQYMIKSECCRGSWEVSAGYPICDSAMRAVQELTVLKISKMFDWAHV